MSKWLLLVFSLFMATGCGLKDGKVNLAGRVSVATGEPIVRGRLIFRATGAGEDFVGRTDEQGNYSAGTPSGIPGIKPGNYIVSVIEYRGDLNSPLPYRAHQKYRRPTSSGLEVTVPTEEGTYDLVLDPPGTGSE